MNTLNPSVVKKKTITFTMTQTFEMDYDYFVMNYDTKVDELACDESVSNEQKMLMLWDEICDNNKSDNDIEPDDTLDPSHIDDLFDDYLTQAHDILFICEMCGKTSVGNYGESNTPFCEEHKTEFGYCCCGKKNIKDRTCEDCDDSDDESEKSDDSVSTAMKDIKRMNDAPNTLLEKAYDLYEKDKTIQNALAINQLESEALKVYEVVLTNKQEEWNKKIDEILAIPLPPEPKETDEEITERRLEAYNALDNEADRKTFRMDLIREDYERIMRNRCGNDDDYPLDADQIHTFWDYQETLRLSHKIDNQDFWEKWVKYHQMVQESNDMGEIDVLEWDYRECCWDEASVDSSNEFSEADAIVITPGVCG